MIGSTNTVGTTTKDSSTAKAPKNRSAHTSHSYVSTAECRFVNKTFEKNYPSPPLHLSLLHRIGLSVR
mgnify:CR=1 FL=1